MKWLKIPNEPRTFESRSDALGYLGALARLLSRGIEVEGRPRSGVSTTVVPFSITP
jgi:hypothetical protein